MKKCKPLTNRNPLSIPYYSTTIQPVKKYKHIIYPHLRKTESTLMRFSHIYLVDNVLFGDDQYISFYASKGTLGGI